MKTIRRLAVAVTQGLVLVALAAVSHGVGAQTFVSQLEFEFDVSLADGRSELQGNLFSQLPQAASYQVLDYRRTLAWHVMRDYARSSELDHARPGEAVAGKYGVFRLDSNGDFTYAHWLHQAVHSPNLAYGEGFSVRLEDEGGEIRRGVVRFRVTDGVASPSPTLAGELDDLAYQRILSEGDGESLYFGNIFSQPSFSPSPQPMIGMVHADKYLNVGIEGAEEREAMPGPVTEPARYGMFGLLGSGTYKYELSAHAIRHLNAGETVYEEFKVWWMAGDGSERQQGVMTVRFDIIGVDSSLVRGNGALTLTMSPRSSSNGFAYELNAWSLAEDHQFAHPMSKYQDGDPFNLRDFGSFGAELAIFNGVLNPAARIIRFQHGDVIDAEAVAVAGIPHIAKKRRLKSRLEAPEVDEAPGAEGAWGHLKIVHMADEEQADGSPAAEASRYGGKYHLLYFFDKGFPFPRYGQDGPARDQFAIEISDGKGRVESAVLTLEVPPLILVNPGREFKVDLAPWFEHIDGAEMLKYSREEPFNRWLAPDRSTPNPFDFIGTLPLIADRRYSEATYPDWESLFWGRMVMRIQNPRTVEEALESVEIDLAVVDISLALPEENTPPDAKGNGSRVPFYRDESGGGGSGGWVNKVFRLNNGMSGRFVINSFHDPEYAAYRQDLTVSRVTGLPNWMTVRPVYVDNSMYRERRFEVVIEGTAPSDLADFVEVIPFTLTVSDGEHDVSDDFTLVVYQPYLGSEGMRDLEVAAAMGEFEYIFQYRPYVPPHECPNRTVFGTLNTTITPTPPWLSVDYDYEPKVASYNATSGSLRVRGDTSLATAGERHHEVTVTHYASYPDSCLPGGGCRPDRRCLHSFLG